MKWGKTKALKTYFYDLDKMMLI